MKKRAFLVLAILLVLLGTQQFAGQTKMPSKPVEVSTGAATTSGELAQVSRVIDGDTVDLVDGRRVRFVGIDTAEVSCVTCQVSRKTDECFAKEAREENTRLVGGKTVRLEKDITDKDKYGRLLRYVYVDGVLVNDALVRGGFARVMGIPPDTTLYAQLKQAQEEAKVQKKGLWNACN